MGKEFHCRKMTVKQLINYLEACDPKAQVIVDNRDCFEEGYYRATNIEELGICDYNDDEEKKYVLIGTNYKKKLDF